MLANEDPTRGDVPTTSVRTDHTGWIRTRGMAEL